MNIDLFVYIIHNNKHIHTHTANNDTQTHMETQTREIPSPSRDTQIKLLNATTKLHV